ncbi:TonB-dependent receptor [Hymenobacter rigui]|uniref:TonB-dependent receptor n=1 Tax=Hymenobacter rigui TaxID=334424 RepID=A0A3R9P424_9BACT|nr:TonB-dependent receptor [Hymenobacter rigui]RSK43840.1 TonB-dependent receptor [Hymenobacter rigui]
MLFIPNRLAAGCLAAAGSILACSETKAQARLIPISGTVLSTAGPLEFATVTLHQATDSAVIKTEFSDQAGHFTLAVPTEGRYLVSVNQLGYGRYWHGPVVVGSQPCAALECQLKPIATQLQNVTVTGQRPLFERLPDRTVVNVEGSVLSAGNTSLDVLARAPGVTLDANDNLGLRGRQGLLVVLDGKRVPLTGSELAAMLRALPAEQVATMELITNPPAKYDAQGGAGVIVINLKKDQRLGFNGSTNAAYGRGRYGKFTSGLTLNYRRKNLNLFGSYAYADRQTWQQLTIDRMYLQDGQPARFLEQTNIPRGHLQSHTWRAGADVTLSSRTSLGLAVSGLESQLPSIGPNESRLYDAQHQLTDVVLAQNQRNLLTPNTTANVLLRHLFQKDSLGTPELTMDADAGRYRLTRTLDLASASALRPGALPNRLLGDQQGTLTLLSAKTDYLRNLRHGLRLETGLKVSRVTSRNDVLFEREQNGGSRQPDTNLSNQFRYEETIRAGYFTLSRSGPRLSISAGLRAEQTNTLGQQAVGNQEFSRRYFQLFPSLSLQRPISEVHQLAFSLSRRLDRPTYNQLNPFRSYVDPTSYRVGNPGLWPQISTQAEVSHTYRHQTTTALRYTYTRRPILSVYLLDPDGLIAATDVNLASQDYWGLTVSSPFTPTAWWKLYANAELFYIRFRGRLQGSPLPPSQPGAILSLNSTFILSKGWSAELSGSYNSLERYGYQLVRSYGQLGMGVQKTLGRATLKLNAADALYTLPLRATSRYQPLSESFRSAQDSRVVTASVTYRFGNDKVTAARRRTGSAEEEKRRASGVQ